MFLSFVYKFALLNIVQVWYDVMTFLCPLSIAFRFQRKDLCHWTNNTVWKVKMYMVLTTKCIWQICCHYKATTNNVTTVCMCNRRKQSFSLYVPGCNYELTGHWLRSRAEKELTTSWNFTRNLPYGAIEGQNRSTWALCNFTQTSLQIVVSAKFLSQIFSLLPSILT